MSAAPGERERGNIPPGEATNMHFLDMTSSLHDISSVSVFVKQHYNIWNMYCDICTDVCISCRRLLDKRHAMQCLVSVTPSLTPGPQSRLCVHTIGSRYQPIWRSKA